MAQVKLTRTPIGMSDYARALLLAWRDELGVIPTKAAAGVLWSQYMIETGGKACWNWNIGNVKISASQVAAGLPWIDLPGTWEIIGGKRVVLADGDPGRRFRAFDSLADAMAEHFKFLRGRRYAVAWPSVEAGDCAAFARRLKAAGYFTAPAEDYARGMLGHHRQWMGSRVWDTIAVQEAETLRELPAAASSGNVPAAAAVLEEDGGAGRRSATTEAIVDAARDLITRRNGG